MKEYAKRKIIENSGEITAASYDTTAQLFTTSKGDIKDIDLYYEKDNLEYVKQLESDYIERKFTKAEKKRIRAASRGEKEEVKSQIKEERRTEFKKVMLAQAQKSDSMQAANTNGGNLEVFATKLMLSLNYLSTQELFKKENLVNKLQNTAGMLGDIVRFGEQTLETDETLFNATLYTITTMFGYVKKNLDELKTEVRNAITQASIDVIFESDEKKKEALNSDINLRNEIIKTIDDLADGAGSIGSYIVRLESRGLDASKQISEKGGKVLWRDLFKSTFTSEVIEHKQVSDSGAGTSVVYKLEKGKDSYYFKGNEIVDDKARFIANVFQNEDYSVEVLREYFGKNDGFASTILNLFAHVWYFYNDSQKAETNKERADKLSQCRGELTVLLNELDAINYDIDPAVLLDLAVIYGKEANSLDVAQGKAHLSAGDNLTLRNHATEHLAFLFGADKLVVKSKDATLDTGDVKTEGFIMEAAKGKSIVDIYNEEYLPLRKAYLKDKTGIEPKLLVSKKAMEQIMTLRFMDAVAGQVDRHMGNIIGEFEIDSENQRVIITGIKGIDNDMSFGEEDDLIGLLEDVTDEYKFDYCPRALFEAVKTITPELLRESMANYVEPAHMEAMISRFTRLKNALMENKEIIDSTGEGLLDGKTDMFDNVEDYTEFLNSPFNLDERA